MENLITVSVKKLGQEFEKALRIHISDLRITSKISGDPLSSTLICKESSTLVAALTLAIDTEAVASSFQKNHHLCISTCSHTLKESGCDRRILFWQSSLIVPTVSELFSCDHRKWCA